MTFQSKIELIELVDPAVPVEILASGTLELPTDGIDFKTNSYPAGVLGTFGLQLLTSGDGTLKAEVQTSANGGRSYVTQETVIFETQAEGASHVGFSTPLSSNMRILFTEDGDADPITIDEADLVVQ